MIDRQSDKWIDIIIHVYLIFYSHCGTCVVVYLVEKILRLLD